jgi:hypothetical protein
VRKALEEKYDELGQRIRRAKKMDTMVQQLQTERHLMANKSAKHVCFHG